MTGLNKNNSAIKRIMQEAKELANDPCTDYTAAPLEDDIFEWHCTIRGPKDTEFEGGLYHFRIVLPAEYPFRPPSILMLTPNGRFELNTKICISFTNYHEELWQPAWGVRTAIIGLQGFFPLKGTAAAGVGSIETHTNERKRLAHASRSWVCPHCQVPNLEILPDPSSSSSPQQPSAPSPIPPQLAPTPVAQAVEAPKTDAPPGDISTLESSTTLTSSTSTSTDTSAGDTSITSVDDSEWSDGTPPATVIPPLVVAQSHGSSPRTPVLLDTVICVILVLLFALICRKVL